MFMLVEKPKGKKEKDFQSLLGRIVVDYLTMDYVD